MVTIVLRVVGLLLALAALPAAWYALEALDDIRAQEMEIFKRESRNVRDKLSKEAGDKKLEEPRREIEHIKRKEYLWFGASGVLLVAGLFLLLLPLSRKRKAPAAPLPAMTPPANLDAPFESQPTPAVDSIRRSDG